MKNRKDKSILRRIRSTYAISIVSITLVLFLLGLIGLLVLSSGKLSDYVKENISFSVFLKEDIKDADILRLQKNLDAAPYVKSTEYITKDQAAELMEKELGEDFVELIGENPLPASIEVKMLAEYANPDSIAIIEADLKDFPQVSEVSYQKDLVYLVNQNIQKISLIVLGFCALLAIIAITLINNTIRLMAYSRRFIIRTMQLVGASPGFIRWPFVLNGVIQGLVGSLLAIALLSALIQFSQDELDGLISLGDFGLIAPLFGFVIISGLVMSTLSSFFAVNRYLRMKTPSLYY